MRKARWFRGVLLAAVVCTVGLYCIAATHHHKTLMAELHCPICQVAVHSSLEVYTPHFAPVPPIARIQFVRLEFPHTATSKNGWTVNYQSRAPPVV
jgi:hypothetical protein